MRLIKAYWVAAFLGFGVLSLQAQVKKDDVKKTHKPTLFENWQSRIFLGGNLGLQLGTSTFIDLSPLVGYMVTESFATGLGVTYRYMRFSSQGFVYDNKIVGGRIFGRYTVYNNLFVHAEYEILNSNWYYSKRYFSVESLLAGIGYMQPIGAGSTLMIMGLWTIYSNPIQIYQNPIIRVGFNMGL